MLHLGLELSDKFPGEQPKITLALQSPGAALAGSSPSSSHLAPSAAAGASGGAFGYQSAANVNQPAVYRNYPWSPRWPAAEAAARIIGFLKEEAPVFIGKQQQQGLASGVDGF